MVPSPSPTPPDPASSPLLAQRAATALHWLRLEQEPVLGRTPYRRKKKGERPISVLGSLLADGTILAEVLVNLDALSHAAVLRAPKRPASSPDASRTPDARQIAHLYRHNTRRAVKVLGKVLEHLRRDPLPPGRIQEFLGGDVGRIPPSKCPKPSLKLVELVILAAMYGPNSERFVWNIWHMPSSTAKASLHSTMVHAANFFGLVPFERILELSNPDSSNTATNDPASEQMANSQIGARKLSLVTDDGKSAPPNPAAHRPHNDNIHSHSHSRSHPKNAVPRDNVVVAPMQIAHPDHHNLMEMSQSSIDDPEVLEQRYAYQEANARLQEVARARALVSRLEGSVLGTRGMYTEENSNAPLANTPPPDVLSPTFTPLPEFTSFEAPLPAARKPPVSVQRVQPPQVSLPALDGLTLNDRKVGNQLEDRDILGSSGDDEDEASLTVRRISDESDRSSVPSFSAMHPRALEKAAETPVDDEATPKVEVQETPVLDTTAAKEVSPDATGIAPFLSPIVKDDCPSAVPGGHNADVMKRRSGLQDFTTASDILFTSSVTAPPSAGLRSVDDVPSPSLVLPEADSPTTKVTSPEVTSPQLPPMFMATEKTREENISRAKAGGRKAFVIKPPPATGPLLNPMMENENRSMGSSARAFSPPPLRLSPTASGKSIVENAAAEMEASSSDDDEEALIGDTADNGNKGNAAGEETPHEEFQTGNENMQDPDVTESDSLGVAQRVAKLNLTPATPVSAPLPSAHIPWTPPSPPSVSALVSTFAVKENDRNPREKRTSVRGVSTMSPSPKLFEKLISVWQSSSTAEKEEEKEESEEEEGEKEEDIVVEYTAPADDEEEESEEEEEEESEEEEEEEEEVTVEYTAPSRRDEEIAKEEEVEEEEVVVEYTAGEDTVVEDKGVKEAVVAEPTTNNEVFEKAADSSPADDAVEAGNTNSVPRSQPNVSPMGSDTELPVSPGRGRRRRAIRIGKSPLQQTSLRARSGEPSSDGELHLDTSVQNAGESGDNGPRDSGRNVADFSPKSSVEPPSSEITTSTTSAGRRNMLSSSTLLTDTQSKRLSHESQQGTSSAHPSVELGSSSGNHGIRVECGSVRVEKNRLDWLTQQLLAARDAINEKSLELHIAEKDRTDEKEVLILQKQDAESVVSAMKQILAEREGELREARRRLSVAITGGKAKRRSSTRSFTSEEIDAKVQAEASKKAQVLYNERAKELEASAASGDKMVSGEQFSELFNRFEKSDALTKDVAEKSHTEMNRLWGEVQTSMEENMMQMVDKRDRELADLKIQLAQRQQAVDELQEARLRLVNQNAEVQAEATSAKQERELIITQAAMEISQVQAQLVLVDKFSKKLHETFKETEVLRAQVADSQAKMAAFSSGNTNGLSAREAKELREALANAQEEVDKWKDQAEQAKWEKNEAENRALEMDRLYNNNNVAAAAGGSRNQKRFVGAGEDGGYTSDRTEENGGSIIHHHSIHSMSSGMGEREPTFDSIAHQQQEAEIVPAPKQKVRMWHTIKNMVTGSHKASNKKPPRKPPRQPRQGRHQRQREEVAEPVAHQRMPEPVTAPYSSPKLTPRDFVQSYRGDAEPDLPLPAAPEPPVGAAGTQIPTPPGSVSERSMAASSVESDRDGNRRLKSPRRLKDRRDRDEDALSF